MLNIHSGTKYDTKTEMARAIYREIMSWADKDVDQMTQEEKKDMCMLAFTYKGLAVSGKPELPQTLQKVIAQATRDVTKGNQTERDQMEYEDRVEAGSHLTEEERKMLRELEAEYKKAMEEYNEATREVAGHILAEKDPEKRKKMLEEWRKKDPKMASDIEKTVEDMRREQAQGREIKKPNKSYDETKKRFEEAHRRKGHAKHRRDDFHKKHRMRSGKPDTLSSEERTQYYQEDGAQITGSVAEGLGRAAQSRVELESEDKTQTNELKKARLNERAV